MSLPREARNTTPGGHTHYPRCGLYTPKHLPVKTPPRIAAAARLGVHPDRPGIDLTLSKSRPILPLVDENRAQRSTGLSSRPVGAKFHS